MPRILSCVVVVAVVAVVAIVVVAGEAFREKQPELAHDLGHCKMENCGVAAVQLHFGLATGNGLRDFAQIITDVQLMFGTQLKKGGHAKAEAPKPVAEGRFKNAMRWRPGAGKTEKAALAVSTAAPGEAAAVATGEGALVQGDSDMEDEEDEEDEDENEDGHSEDEAEANAAEPGAAPLLGRGVSMDSDV